jgi:hypothetical protein
MHAETVLEDSFQKARSSTYKGVQMTCDFCDVRPCKCDAPTLHKDDVIAAIEREEEFDGEMPQELFEKISRDRETMQRAFRFAARKTKMSIARRICEL